ncbi:MAG: flippase-like domain-containing protein [Firmicutes bacterium]|nr:flippase-like domain-containing protein [Bacillota bacterium]
MKKKNIILLFVLTIIILFFTMKDNYKEIIDALLNINIFWVIISYLLVLSYTFFKTLVTHDVINSFKKNKFNNTFFIQIITFFFNAITPFCTGGQPFQVYMFNKSGNKLVDSTNTVVQETIIHQIALLVVGITSIVLNSVFNIIELDGMLSLFLGVGFLVNVSTILLLLVLSNTKKINKIIINFFLKIISIFKKVDKEKEKIYDSIEKFNTNSKLLLKNKLRFIKLILMNAFALICLYLVPVTLMFSLGYSDLFNSITSIVLVTFTSLISCFIPLPGGTVAQEYVFIVLFSAFVSNPLVSTLMILWRFITYYFPLIVGAIILNIKQKDFFTKSQQKSCDKVC